MITGQIEAEIQSRMVSYSNLEVMTKPIRKARLLENVTSLLKYTSQLTELSDKELLKIDLGAPFDTRQLKAPTIPSLSPSTQTQILRSSESTAPVFLISTRINVAFWKKWGDIPRRFSLGANWKSLTHSMTSKVSSEFLTWINTTRFSKGRIRSLMLK